MNNINRIIGVNLNNPSIVTFFMDNKEIGKLIIRDNKLEFVGDAHKSAMVFLNKIVKPVVDNYIKEKLESLN